MEAVCVNDTAVFNVLLSNANEDATDLMMTIQEASNLQFAGFEAPAGTTYNPVTKQWTVDTLRAGTYKILTLKYNTLSNLPAATLINRATLVQVNGETLAAIDQIISEKAVTVFARPSGTLNMDASFVCSGSPVTLSFGLVGTAPFTIEYHNGTQMITRSGVPALYNEVIQNITSKRVYQIHKITDANGCSTQYSDGSYITDSVDVIPLPTVTLTADTACMGGNANVTFYRGTGVGDLEISYNVAGTPAGTITLVGSDTTIALYGLTARTTVQVTKVIDNQCENNLQSSGSIVYVEIRSLPTASVTVSPSVCVGSDGWARFNRPTTVGATTITYTVNDAATFVTTIPDGASTVTEAITGLEGTTEVKILSVANLANGLSMIMVRNR